MRKKLIETVNLNNDGTGIRDGIFQYIYGLIEEQEEPELPWLTDALSKELDNDYYLIHSGEKLITRHYEQLLALADDGKISSAEDMLARTILNRFKLSWNKIRS